MANRDPHNLVAHTVQGHRGTDLQQKRRTRCRIGHAIDPWANGGRSWTWCHRWIDGPAGTRRTDGRHSVPGSTCLNCGKTLREIMILVRPEPPLGSKAHLERALHSGR